MSLILDGTNGLSDVDGSAATPAIRGSDANTGVFFGTDIVGVSTGGSERVRVDASGNVGIGTSSPAGRLDVNRSVAVSGLNGVAANPALTITNPANYGWSVGMLFRAPLVTGAAPSNNAAIWAEWSADTSAYLGFATSGGGTLAERARITSGGDLLVGTTVIPTGSTGGACFEALSDNRRALKLASTTTGSATLLNFVNPNGSVGTVVTSGSSTSYVTSSDYRLKHDIQPMTGALAKVAQLKPVTYKWNADDSESQGFIAHELQEVVPECVTGEKDAVDAEGNPQYQGIDTSFLVATLTAAIQEQQAIITALTARVEALEGAQA
jgi:hypothetical protein